MKNFSLIFLNFMLIITGFISSKILHGSGSKTKLILQWKKFCYHIHHWITFTFFIIIINLINNIPFIVKRILTYLFLGIILEDFTFNGIFKIKEKCSIKEY